MKKAASKAFVGIVLAVLAIVTLLPVIWVLISSLKTRKEMTTLPWGLPEVFQWENYTKAWEKADFQILMKNSICITAVSLVFMILLSSMMAFAITRYHVRARKLVLMYMLVGQTISTGMITFPIVILLRKLGLDGGLAGLILTYIAGGLPFAVFVMQGFFAGIPYELYEAAEMDGATELDLYRKVAIPLAKPSLATVLLYQFMWVWNEFILAFTVISKKENRTIIVGLYSVVNGNLQTDYVTAFAGAVIVCVPIVLIYLIFQKYLIEGLVAGAVKG